MKTARFGRLPLAASLPSMSLPASGHVTSAQVEAIPAGVQVVPDEDWPATLALDGLPLPGEALEGEDGPDATTL